MNRLPLTAESVYRVVTDDTCNADEDQLHDIGTTYRAIARRMGYDEMDSTVHELIKAMAVSGYIKQGPLGAFGRGPTPLPASTSRAARQPVNRPRVTKHRTVWINQGVPVPDDAVSSLGAGSTGYNWIPYPEFYAGFRHRDKRCELCGRPGREHEWVIRNDQGKSIRCPFVDGPQPADRQDPAGVIAGVAPPGTAEPAQLVDALGRLWVFDGGDIYVHNKTTCKLAWTKESILNPDIQRPTARALENPNYQFCAICRGESATVIPGVDQVLADANRQQAAADRALADRLDASAAAGNMTAHGMDDACSLGFWHEGPCPDAELERQLQIEDRAEDNGMDPNDRETCSTHRTWFKDCVATDPMHSNPVTKFNWCGLHYGPVHECRCWTPNLAGRPLPGDEPTPLAEDWVNWFDDPRVHSDGTKGGMSIDTRQGVIRVLPHSDGQWRVEGPYSMLRYFPTRHEGALAAVDNEVHPRSVRRPAGQRTAPAGPVGVIPGVNG